MKKLFISLAAITMVATAHAVNVTNYFPNGQFEDGGAGAWVEGGCDFFQYPTEGGNPNGYGIIDDVPTHCYGFWVGGDSVPLSLASLGLTAGQTYTFVQDMKLFAGTTPGGVKIESWRTNASGVWSVIDNSGEMRPLSISSNWATYSFTYTVNALAKGLKIVPVWGSQSTVGFDNLGVVLVGATPLSVSITSPTNTQVVYSNFTVMASASVNPGAVTNVSFYLDNNLVSSVTNTPYGYVATGVAAGPHTIMAVARSSIGGVSTSSVVNVTVTSTPPPPFRIYESFNYGSLGNGTPATGTGLAGNWNGSAGNIVSGLTYPGLPTANSALQSGSGAQLVSLSNAPSGIDTVWASFILNQAGDNGGNRDGMAFVDAFGKGVMFAYQQFQATVGKPALVRLSNFTTVGAQFTPTSANTQTYANNNFYVLRLSYTGGALSSVAVYTNPDLSQTNPPPADFTVSSGFSGIGAINSFGLVHQGAISLTADEVRMGSTYADVTGKNLNPTIPTTLSLVINTNKRINWSATSTNYYEPQKSSDSNSWADIGPVLFGSSVTSLIDPAPDNFYQVLELEAVTQEQLADGGIEVDGGGGIAFYWNGLGTQPPTRTTADFHSGTACLALSVSNATTTAQTCEAQQNLIGVGQPGITGGNAYTFSFWAKSLPKNPAGGYVQQYRVTWLASGGGVVGAVGFANFTSSTDGWTQTTTGPVVAPTNAVNALIQISCITGGISNDFGGVLVDDVSLAGFVPGNVVRTLVPTVQTGQTFAATVKNGGINATDSQGLVQFKTNNVSLGSVVVSNAVAVSDPVIMPANYSIAAIYSGDATYIGSSATINVGNVVVVNPNPTNLGKSVAGNQLTLSWPSDHTGWTLQTQTNSRNAGLSGAWFDVSGSTVTNQMTMTIDPANPTVFYRLRYAP